MASATACSRYSVKRTRQNCSPAKLRRDARRVCDYYQRTTFAIGTLLALRQVESIANPKTCSLGLPAASVKEPPNDGRGLLQHLSAVFKKVAVSEERNSSCRKSCSRFGTCPRRARNLFLISSPLTAPPCTSLIGDLWKLDAAHWVVCGLNWLHSLDAGPPGAPCSAPRALHLRVWEHINASLEKHVDHLDAGFKEIGCLKLREAPLQAFSEPLWCDLNADAVGLGPVACTCDAMQYTDSYIADSLQNPSSLFESYDGMCGHEAYIGGARSEYIRLVGRELRAGKLTLGRKARGLGGVFGVREGTSCRMRKVWNGKVISRICRKPPKPVYQVTPAAFRHVDRPKGQRMWVSKRDVASCLNCLAAPPALNEFFGQALVTVRELLQDGFTPREVRKLLKEPDSIPLRPSHKVFPLNRCFPMAS